MDKARLQDAYKVTLVRAGINIVKSNAIFVCMFGDRERLQVVITS